MDVIQPREFFVGSVEIPEMRFDPCEPQELFDDPYPFGPHGVFPFNLGQGLPVAASGTSQPLDTKVQGSVQVYLADKLPHFTEPPRHAQSTVQPETPQQPQQTIPNIQQPQYLGQQTVQTQSSSQRAVGHQRIPPSYPATQQQATQPEAMQQEDRGDGLVGVTGVEAQLREARLETVVHQARLEPMQQAMQQQTSDRQQPGDRLLQQLLAPQQQRVHGQAQLAQQAVHTQQAQQGQGADTQVQQGVSQGQGNPGGVPVAAPVAATMLARVSGTVHAAQSPVSRAPERVEGLGDISYISRPLPSTPGPNSWVLRRLLRRSSRPNSSPPRPNSSLSRRNSSPPHTRHSPLPAWQSDHYRE